MSAAAQPLAGAGRRRDTAAELARWWPLAALTLLAAVLRLSTLGLQSFWYDEAFTVVRDLHPSLGSTLHSVVHTENNPPLWYLIAWADSRVLGTGAVALRLPSALCGIALVPVAWAHRRRARRAAPGDPDVRRWWRSTRCTCGTRRRPARTACSCSPPGWRSSASCAPTASPHGGGWRCSR